MINHRDDLWDNLWDYPGNISMTHGITISSWESHSVAQLNMGALMVNPEPSANQAVPQYPDPANQNPNKTRSLWANHHPPTGQPTQPTRATKATKHHQTTNNHPPNHVITGHGPEAATCGLSFDDGLQQGLQILKWNTAWQPLNSGS